MQQRLDRIAVAAAPAIDEVAVAPVPPAKALLRQAVVIVSCLGVSALLVVLGYLAMAVPGPWFTTESARSVGADMLELVRGTGMRSGDMLIVNEPGGDNLAIISTTTDFRADRFRALWWVAAGLPEHASARVVWRTDTRPGQTFSLPLVVEAGRPRPVPVAGAPGWIGTIKGLGLVISGPFPQPLQIRGVIAKPMDALEILGDRAAEWLALESWTGTSINVVVGGADAQDLPLPVLVATIVGLASLLLLAVHRWRRPWMPNLAVGVGIAFAVGWLVLDLRWTTNLARQLGITWHAYAGKPQRERSLAAADGQLYAFIEQVRATLPATPQRIWVVSDAPFFSGRAAYHLYPHNVHFEPRGRAMPDPKWIRAGDWILVFIRQGVEFDASRGILRWDGLAGINVEKKAGTTGAALFLVK